MSPLHLTLHESQLLTPLDLHTKAFLLDREAARCTPKTMTHYMHTLGTFVGWLQHHGVDSPEETTAHHVKAYLARRQHREGAQSTFTR
jgi:site-specific recombinase XerD